MDDAAKKTGDMFHDKEVALDIMSSSLQMVEALAKRHGFPLIVVVQPDEYVMSTWHHFPEATSSELKAAWYEIAGPEDEH